MRNVTKAKTAWCKVGEDIWTTLDGKAKQRQKKMYFNSEERGNLNQQLQFGLERQSGRHL